MPYLDTVSFLLRKNSVVIDIKAVTGGNGITPADQYSLVKQGLKVKPGQVAEIQLHSVSRNLIVGFEGDEIYASALKKLEQGIIWNKYPGIKIHGWSTSEYLTPITVMNWSKYLNFEMLKSRLENYGKIISYQFGVFKEDPLCKNGNIHLRMKLKAGAEIPAFVEIPGAAECLQIYSDNTEKVCFRCTEKGHIAPWCRKKAKKVDYSKNQNPTWACIASQNIGGNASKSIEVVKSKQADGAPDIAAAVAGTSKQTDAAVDNATEIVVAVDGASKQVDPVVNAPKTAVADASKQSNVVENAPRTSGAPTPSQLSATPLTVRSRKNARKAGDDILPAGKLSAQKKAKKGNFPERQEVIESSDDGMDHDADVEEDDDEVNDSNKSQKLSSHNSIQKNDVIDSSSIENPSQKIEEFSSQESSKSGSSMLPPGQGCTGSLSKLKKKTLSVGDLSYSDSDLSTQSSELKRQKEHEEQVLWNACAN